MTLTEFLLARIAEDEAVARAAVDGELYASSSSEAWVKWTVKGMERVGMSLDSFEHVDRWQPARVLAECESKRRIVALHSAEPGQHPDFCGHDLRELPCPTLRVLALPYAGHPGCAGSWDV